METMETSGAASTKLSKPPGPITARSSLRSPSPRSISKTEEYDLREPPPLPGGKSRTTIINCTNYSPAPKTNAQTHNYGSRSGSISRPASVQAVPTSPVVAQEPARPISAPADELEGS
jgi:hypothetical protein